MSKYMTNRRLGAELVKRGLIPETCRLLELVVDINGPMIIRYEVLVPTEQMTQIAEALIAVAKEEDDRHNRPSEG